MAITQVLQSRNLMSSTSHFSFWFEECSFIQNIIHFERSFIFTASGLPCSHISAWNVKAFEWEGFDMFLGKQGNHFWVLLAKHFCHRALVTTYTFLMRNLKKKYSMEQKRIPLHRGLWRPSLYVPDMQQYCRTPCVCTSFAFLALHDTELPPVAY